MTHIADVCLCIPEYVPNVRQVINQSTIKACNFYEHATCVSYVKYYFDPTVVQCLPACSNSVYYRARIQYAGEPEEIMTKLDNISKPTFECYDVLVLSGPRGL